MKYNEIKKIPKIKIYTLTNENRDTTVDNIFHEIHNSI